MTNIERITLIDWVHTIQSMMRRTRPDMPLNIDLVCLNEHNIQGFTDFERRYHGLLTGEKFITIREAADNYLLYAVNVTGDSILTAVGELMNLIARKF